MEKNQYSCIIVKNNRQVMKTICICILLLSGKKELTKRQNEQALLIFYHNDMLYTD